MAAIAHGIVQQLADQTDGTGAWVTALQDPLANYVAGGKYLIIVTAQVTGDSVADRFEFQTLHAAATFEGSQLSIYPEDATIATHRNSYAFMTVFDQPGVGAEDINFQFMTVNAAQNVYADSIQIFRMRLDADLVENADWKYGEDDDSGAPIEHGGGAFADFASATFTPANAGDEWLVIGVYNYLVDNAAVNAEYRINRDSDTEVAPMVSQMGSNVAEQRCGLLIRPFQLTKVAHTFKMQGQDSGGDAAQNDHYYTAIIAIRMNAFADFEYVWDEAEFTFGAPATFEEIAALDFTPSAGADFLVLAACAGDAAAATRYHGLRIQDGGATDPAGHDAYYDSESHHANDEPMATQMAMPTLAAALEDLDLDGQASDVGELAEDIAFVALSMELAGAPAGPAGGFGAGASAIGM